MYGVHNNFSSLIWPLCLKTIERTFKLNLEIQSLLLYFILKTSDNITTPFNNVID